MAADPFEFIDSEYGCGQIHSALEQDSEYGCGQIHSALEQERFRLAPYINHSSSNNNASTLPGSAEEDPQAAAATTSRSQKKKKKEASSSSSSSDSDAEPSSAAPSTRTLPATILNPNANPHAVLPTLEQVVSRCSRETDTPLDHADLLDVGDIMGIHFDPPSWWRPGGYH